MEDYYEYLDSNGVTTLYKLIKDDTVALIDSYSVTINGITTTLDTHINDSDIHTPISDIENMVDTKVSGLVNSAPETLDTLKELSDALGNDPNFATTVANQIGNKASKDDVYTKEETDTLLEGKADSVHNHVVKDITDFPTIPTKTSELINDSGFLTSSSGVITSVSWSDITDKPNFATVATSGSYTDLSNTPTIPTKVSQLENDTGFINALTDVVDTKSNQTINGTKTFTVAPFVSNNATTNGYFIKLNTIARNDVPSQLYHATFRAHDKNNLILGEYCVEKSTTGASLLHMNVRSEDSNGKQLSESLYLNMSNDGNTVRFYPSSNNKMDLGMPSNKWAKIYSDDVVHTSGNETINGSKTFTQGINIKNSDIDLTATPTSNKYSQNFFTDKNNKLLGIVQYAQRSTDVNDLDLYVYDKNSTAHGIQITTNNVLSPIGNNYKLGSSSSKWSDIYSTNAHINNTYTNRVTTYSITHPSDNSYSFMSGGSDYDKGAALYLGGISATNFTPGRFVLVARKTDAAVELTGSPNGTLTWGGKNVAIDENLVHTSGNEHINGTKMFSNTIHRYADLTTSGYEQVYRFDDINANSCGHIYNNVHWTGDAVYNRYGAYNNKSGKSMEIDIISPDSGVGMAYVSGTATKGNLETVTSAAGHTGIATMGWVNNPATSTNVVHRSGDETIAGNKTFTNRVSFPSGYYITTDTNDNSLRIIRDGSNHGNNYKVIIQGDTGKFFAPNGFIGNLQGNAATATSATSATKASYLDNYSSPNANKIYLDWDHQVKGYVGLKVDNTVMGGLITTDNLGSQNVVHKTGNETINGIKVFTDTIYKKNSALDLQVNPSSNQFNSFLFTDKNNAVMGYLEHLQTTTGVNVLGLVTRDKNNGSHGIQVTSEDNVIPLGNGVVNLGLSGAKWKNVYATTFNGNLKGTIDSTTTATTQATTDNSTRIATTAWVRNYVNSVVGSGAVGASISAYYSNATTLTAESSSTIGTNLFPAVYSGYINIAPTVGTIYTGSQLFSSFTPTASGTKSSHVYQTTAYAKATFSGAFSASAKYLCTTANAVKFRAYVSQGTISDIGTASVVDNSSTKSIFIRVQ